MTIINENPFKRDTPVIPFGGSGEAYRQWDDENCQKCSKCERESRKAEESGCELEYYISLGTITSEIPLWVAKAVGCEYDALYGTVNLSKRCYKKPWDED
jgi:hypothetical protein